MNNIARQALQKIILFVMVVLLASCGYFIQPKINVGVFHLEKGNYKIDPQHTTVLFKINHMGMSTFVGRFNQVDASLEFDPNDIANAKLSAVINVNSIDVNNRELEESLRGSSWFDTEKYPQAFFKTTSVELLDEKHAQFNGVLTFRGVSKSIAIDVIFNGGGNNVLTGHYTLGFSAASTFKRSSFGMDYLIPAVADDVDIEVFTEFQQQNNL